MILIVHLQLALKIEDDFLIIFFLLYCDLILSLVMVSFVYEIAGLFRIYPKLGPIVQ